MPARGGADFGGWGVNHEWQMVVAALIGAIVGYGITISALVWKESQ